MVVKTAYNNAAQAFTAAGTTINVLGTQVADCGVCVDVQTGGFRILSGGMYRVSYDVEFEADGAGTATLQLMNGSTALPCAVAATTAADGSTYTLHVETTAFFGACRMIQNLISAQIGGVAGTVNHVCATVVKV